MRHGQFLGFSTLCIAMLLILMNPETTAFLYSILLLTASLQILLWSAYRINHAPAGRGWVGRRLTRGGEPGFAALHFLLHNMFMVLAAGSIWISLPALGLDVRSWQHMLFVLLLIFVPVKRILSKYGQTRPSDDRLHRLHDITAYGNVIAAVLLTVLSLHRGIAPPDRILSQDDFIFLTLIWVPSALIVIACVVQILARAFDASSPSMKQWRRKW